MIELLAIVDALPRLTGDATKLAVFLSATPTERADAAWIRLAAAGIGTSPAIVRTILKELAESGLIRVHHRVNLASMSDPVRKIDPREAGQAELAEEEIEPWLRKGGFERSEKPARQLREEPDLPETPDPDPKAEKLAIRQRAIDEFSTMFADVTDGVKPTWDGKTVNMMKQLLAAHGFDEVVRRARIMFYEPRKFPQPPYDMGTLRSHFDRFAVSRPSGGMVGDKRMTTAAYYGDVDRG